MNAAFVIICQFISYRRAELHTLLLHTILCSSERGRREGDDKHPTTEAIFVS